MHNPFQGREDVREPPQENSSALSTDTPAMSKAMKCRDEGRNRETNTTLAAGCVSESQAPGGTKPRNKFSIRNKNVQTYELPRSFGSPNNPTHGEEDEKLTKCATKHTPLPSQEN